MARRTTTSMLAILVILVIALATPRRARAQDKPTLSGSWSASGVSEAWSIGDWGEACGPKPRGAGGGGGSVQIKEMSGELSISGAGRAWSTGECWEQMPGLARTSHSASGGGRFWRTRCSTPQNDARRATIVTTTSATDATIVMNETGQYQFVLHDQNCTASVTRTRSYSLSHREGDGAAAASAAPSAAPATSAPPPAPTPSQAEAKPATARSCASPGDAARLEVFPSRKLLRPGDRFSFRALVLDDAGCAVPTKPAWSIGGEALGGKASVDASGAVVIATDAAEGRFDLTASVSGKGVSIPIEIATPEHYDALLASSGLNAAGESEQAAIAIIATGTIGGRAAVAEDGAKERKRVFLAIVGFLAACLGLAGVALMRRGKHAARRDATAEGSSNREGRADAGTTDTAGGPEIEASQAAEPAAPPSTAKGKICPTCGDRYPGNAEFCGKDGTTLVLLN